MNSQGLVLVVGTGSIGKRHLSNAIRLGRRRFVTVDPRIDRCEEANKIAYGQADESEDRSAKQALNIQYYTDTALAYENHASDCDFVIIASPPKYHLEHMMEAVQYQIPVFCEKPLVKDDVSREVLDDLLAQVGNQCLPNMVAYNYRFLPQLMKFRELVRGGTIGKVLSIRGEFSENVREWHPWEGLDFYMSSLELGGGALLDESHLVDICRWIFGEITEVSALNETVSSLQKESIFETDDLVEMIVRFQSGAVGSIHMDLFGKFHQKKIEVLGETGTLFWFFDNTDLSSNRIELWRGRRSALNESETRRVPEEIYNTDWHDRNHMYLEQLKHFMGWVDNNIERRQDIADLEDGCKTMDVLEAARRSSESGKFEKVRGY